ncbi:MAG: DUF998 domain-containing protein [bacterium]
MLNYIGIINIIFFIATVAILIRKNPWFTIKKHTLSDLARSEKTGKLFNLTLLIFSVNQVIFAVAVYLKLADQVSHFVLPLFIIGGIFLGFASFFTTHKYPLIHTITAILCTACVGTAVILLAIALLKINYFWGLLIIGATASLPLIYINKRFLPGGIFEIPIFSVIALWNFIFSLLLFGYIK